MLGFPTIRAHTMQQCNESDWQGNRFSKTARHSRIDLPRASTFPPRYAHLSLKHTFNYTSLPPQTGRGRESTVCLHLHLVLFPSPFLLLRLCLSTSLSLSLSIYLSLSLPLSLSLSVCLPVRLSIYLSVYLPICLIICLSIFLSFYLFIYLCVCVI
jgi:hypothetical protein